MPHIRTFIPFGETTISIWRFNVTTIWISIVVTWKHHWIFHSGDTNLHPYISTYVIPFTMAFCFAICNNTPPYMKIQCFWLIDLNFSRKNWVHIAITLTKF
jgi:hypothetical protein